MSYVDGFVLCVPTDKLDEYKKIAKKAAKIWKEHGALDYKECVGEDLESAAGYGMVTFTKLAKPKEGESVVFSFIVYKNRKQRDTVNKKVMSDPRLKCDPSAMPFDCKRMAYGGFKTFVEG